MDKNITPLVSLLIPVFNGEKYIFECIESLLNQTYKNIEIIVVNDGSTDKTALIIQNFNNPKIHLINHEKNKGVVEARNTCLKNASGKYYANIDADDIALPERLETQVRFMEQNPNIGVCGSFVEVFEAGTGVFTYPTTDEEIKIMLLFSSPFANSATIIRSEIIKNNNINYHTDFKPAEDFKLWTDLSKFTRFANINKILVRYRIHKNQISGNKAYSSVSCVQDLRFNNIIKIGKNINQNDKEVHIKLIDNEVYSFAELDSVKKWKDCLIDANDTHDNYNSLLFNRFMNNLFNKCEKTFLFNFFIGSSSKNIKKLLKFLSLKSTYRYFKPRQIITFAIKSIINKK